MKTRVVAWIEDDTDLIKESITKYLSQGKYELREYFDYAQALSAMNEIRQADLILLDLILPIEYGIVEKGSRHLGLKFLRELRAAGPGVNQPPVIVFSVVADADSVVTAFELERLQAVPIPKFSRLKRLRAEIERLTALRQMDGGDPRQA